MDTPAVTNNYRRVAVVVGGRKKTNSRTVSDGGPLVQEMEPDAPHLFFFSRFYTNEMKITCITDAPRETQALIKIETQMGTG